MANPSQANSERIMAARALIDPTAALDPAMAASSVACLMGERASWRMESPLGDEITDDLEISDDSFAQTPSPLKKSLKREVRPWRGDSRKRRVIPSGRPARSASAGALRGLARPPSPPVQTAGPEHLFMSPAGQSGEDRLDALERQQKYDHSHFQALDRLLQDLFKFVDHPNEKVKQVQQSQAEHAQMGLNLRRELYGMRDKLEADLHSAGGILETRTPHGHRGERRGPHGPHGFS